MESKFKIGDSVLIKSNLSCYASSLYDVEEYPIDTIGTIVYIRSRYDNTPNHYVQYKVIANEDPKQYISNDLSHLYVEYQLELINIDLT
jgi:hypothetical protein